MNKVCKKCGVEKDEDYFYTHSRVCLTCINSRSKKYYELHRMEILKRSNSKRRLLKERQFKNRGNYIQWFTPIYNFAKEVDESKLEIPESMCSFFGCGKPLSLIEKLAGNKCTNHMRTIKNIITNSKL